MAGITNSEICAEEIMKSLSDRRGIDLYQYDKDIILDIKKSIIDIITEHINLYKPQDTSEIYDAFFGDGYWEREYKRHIIAFAEKCITASKLEELKNKAEIIAEMDAVCDGKWPEKYVNTFDAIKAWKQKLLPEEKTL